MKFENDPAGIVRNIIISDFDETISKKDTISVLGSIPYVKKPNFEPRWNHFCETYMEGWKEYQKIAPPRKLPLFSSNLTGEISSANYKHIFKREFEFQIFNRLIELYSINELSKYRLFDGITEMDIRNFIREYKEKSKTIVREGFLECLHASVHSIKEDFYILSVNWSKEFIKLAIGEESIEISKIFCNDLLITNNKYNGSFSNAIMTGSDKVITLENILKQIQNQKKKEEERIWYVGDSETDLLSILHPNIIGILLIDPAENLDKFKKITNNILGIDNHLITKFMNHEVTHLELPIKKEGGKKTYIVKSWLVIKKLIASQ